MSVQPKSRSLRRRRSSPEVLDGPAVSVLVLVAGRPEPLPELYRELADVLRGSCERFEFVFVVEPPFFELASSLKELAAAGEPIRVVRVGQRLGATGLLREGLAYCRGPIVVTLPARRRVQTEVLTELIRAVDAGADMAVATRIQRRDAWLNRLQSRVFHVLLDRIVGPGSARIRDMTSGVRAARRDVLERLQFYGDAARFLPLLAIREGYTVKEISTLQHVSDQRRPLPSPLTYLQSIFDLLSLFVVLRFTEKPLRFFGSVGMSALIPGLTLLVIMVIQRFSGKAMADRPALLLGVLFVVLGIQMIALGLVGEIMVHLQTNRRTYRLKQ